VKIKYNFNKFDVMVNVKLSFLFIGYFHILALQEFLIDVVNFNSKDIFTALE
jgi:hypothetical protein